MPESRLHDLAFLATRYPRSYCATMHKFSEVMPPLAPDNVALSVRCPLNSVSALLRFDQTKVACLLSTYGYKSD